MIKHLKIISLLVVALYTSMATCVKAQTVTPEPTITMTPTTVVTVTPTPTAVITPSVVAPGIPQGILVTVISDDRIDVSWNRSSGATAYEVFRNNEVVAVISSLLYSDTGLEPETSYSYKVRAFDGSKYSSFSTTVSATTKSETDDTILPTIPEGPEIDEKTPWVEDKFGFVIIGTESYKYNQLPAFDAGEDFTVNGKTESYADIEVIIKSEPKSYYAKADEEGFWSIKVDTSLLEEGMHTLQIKISADEFPETYESEEYSFEINAKPVEEVVEESGFPQSVRLIIVGVILLVILLFVVGVFVAKKKGLFKKLTESKKVEKEPQSSPVSSFSEDIIQLEDDKPKSQTTPIENLVSDKPQDSNAIPEEPQTSQNASDSISQLDTQTDTTINPLDSSVSQGNEEINLQPDTQTEVTTENNDNALGVSALDGDDQEIAQESEKNENVAHSIQEIDNDGVSVEVEDLGINPYADVIRKNYAQEMPDEDNLPVMDLSTGEMSEEPSFKVEQNEAQSDEQTTVSDLNPKRSLDDFSTFTPVVDQGSNNTVNDSMVSNVSDVPATSIEKEVETQD